MDHLLHRKDKHKSSKTPSSSASAIDKHHHHNSFSGGKHALISLSGHSSCSDIVSPASLDIVIESPPCVFYGTPVNSTGALLSGRLRVTVPGQAATPPTPGAAAAPLSPANVAPSAPPGTALTLNNLRLRLVYTATTKKPVGKDCPECSLRTEELGRWEFLTEPIHLRPGVHDFPFSYLLPGHLPATTMGSLGTVEYSLRAGAAAYPGEDLPPLVMPLRISRAVLPGNDKTSVRIFPPTNLAGKIILPSVVHPIGTFPVQMCLSGVVDTQKQTQTRWRLRKLIWRIEEHQKLVSTACPKHAHKLTGEAVATGGPAHHETRIVGHGEEKTGWKTDFDTAGGEINFEFIASLRPGCEPLCDIFPLLKSDGVTPMNPGALEVRHNLVIELIVAEEFATLSSSGGVKSSTPTGAARVLRMLFHLNVTERSGLGISWDEEMPPVYSDVPPSPPTYAIDPEGEEQIGLTGPGVNATANGGGVRLAKLPQYSRLEQMDSSLTPVQRPQDAHPALQNRVPLALPLQDVASLSLDSPTPRHSFSSHLPPPLASSSSSASASASASASHIPPHINQHGQHNPHNSISSFSALTTSSASSASSSAASIPMPEPTHHQTSTGASSSATPKPIHPAPPHPPVEHPHVLSPSLAPHVLGTPSSTTTTTTAAAAANGSASRRNSRSAYAHPTYAPSLLSRSSTADGGIDGGIDESAVLDVDGDDENEMRTAAAAARRGSQSGISQEAGPRSTQVSLVPSSAVTSATSSSVSLARVSTSSMRSAGRDGVAGASSGNNNHVTIASEPAAAPATIPAPVPASAAPAAVVEKEKKKKKRHSTSFFGGSSSSTSVAESHRSNRSHSRSRSHSHHANPLAPFLAPFVRARSHDRNQDSDREHRHRRTSNNDSSPAPAPAPATQQQQPVQQPVIQAPARAYSRSRSRPAPVPEDDFVPIMGGQVQASSMMLNSFRSRSRPADSGRRRHGSSGVGDGAGRRASTGPNVLMDMMR